MKILLDKWGNKYNKRNKFMSIALMLVLFIFITTGCTRFDINIGIDENYTAYLSYYLEIDVSELGTRQQHSFKEALYQIAIHYQRNLDFVVNLDLESNPIVFEAEKRVANNSFEQALESLKAMLTDENMTAFMKVDMDWAGYPQQMGYILSASMDIHSIIQSSDIEELSPGVRREFEDAIEVGSGRIIITLPADEVETASHDVIIGNGQVVMTVPLEFIGQTEFELSARQQRTAEIANDSILTTIGAASVQLLKSIVSDPGDITIDEQIHLREIAQRISLAAAVFIALTLLITIIVVIAKRRKQGN